MNEFEKVLVFGKIAQDLKNIAIAVGSEGVWLEEDAFENFVRELGIKDINHQWFADCDKQYFYYKNIRFYTIYNENQDGYVPEQKMPDTVYAAVKAEVEKNDLV